MIKKIQARSRHTCSIPFLRGLSLQTQLPNCPFSHTGSNKQAVTMCGMHVISATQVQSFLVFICLVIQRQRCYRTNLHSLSTISHYYINSRFIYRNQHRQASCSNHLLYKNSTESTIGMFARNFGRQKLRFFSCLLLTLFCPK